MNPCPCDTLRAPRRSTPTRKSQRPSALQARLLSALALAALLLSTTAALADDDDRGLSSSPARHVLVKAVGQGVDPGEAEQDALRNARLMAAKHYAALGGAQALDPSPQGLRIIASHSSPPIGFASVRAVVLVELRLRALP